jgi:hypothetical protein
VEETRSQQQGGWRAQGSRSYQRRAEEKGRREGQGKLRREVSKASGELMNPVLS